MPAVAFALPVLPGQEENMRRLSEEVLVSGELRDAYEESRRKLGINREMVWLQPTPVGDMVIVYWESDDMQYVLRELASSQDHFDSRFRQFIQSSVPGMSLPGEEPLTEEPLTNKLLFEWQAI